MRLAVPIGPLLVAGAAAAAECGPEAARTAAAIATHWQAMTPMETAPVVAGDEAALCVQAALHPLMEAAAGPQVGWKVGLTSDAAQAQFGVDHPVAGPLFETMLLRDGAVVGQPFAARGIVEADLIVTVADAGIMDAATPAEVLAHLESLHPFIELADLMVAPGQPLSADIITAINVGARAGVVGEAVPLAATPEWETAMATMTVRMEDGTGKTIAEFPGAAILGQPLNAVLWLTGWLKATGGPALAAGDVISLGGFGPPIPADEVDALTVRYLGLPAAEEPQVSVRLE